MKTRLLLIPLLTLACIATWMVIRNSSGTTNQNHTKHHHRSTTSSAPEEKPRSATTKASIREQPSPIARTLRQCLHLHAIVRSSADYHSKTFEQLRATLDGLEVYELLDLLAALDASNAHEDDRIRLSHHIAASISRRDPALAMDTFVPRIHLSPEGTQRQLDVNFMFWCRDDVKAAAAWLDTQPHGEFELRATLESQLVRTQAALDPDAARQRWSAMSDEAKQNAIHDDWFASMNRERIQSVAEFIRTESNHDPAVLAQAASKRLRVGTLGHAATFIEQLYPNANERVNLATEAVMTRIHTQPHPRITPDEIHDWIHQQVPDQAPILIEKLIAAHEAATD